VSTTGASTLVFVPNYTSPPSSGTIGSVYIQLLVENDYYYVSWDSDSTNYTSSDTTASQFYFSLNGTSFMDFSGLQTNYDGYYMYDAVYNQWLGITNGNLAGTAYPQTQWLFSPVTGATVDFPASTPITLTSVTQSSQSSNVYSYTPSSSTATGILSLLTPSSGVTNLQYALNIFLPSSGVPDSFTVYIECDSSFDYSTVQFFSFPQLGTTQSTLNNIWSSNNFFSFYTSGITAIWNASVLLWGYSFSPVVTANYPSLYPCPYDSVGSCPSCL
jgi:hypothetical protein